MDPTRTPEYFAGYEWAAANLNSLRELFTEREVDTGELRSRLFGEAGKLYPAAPGDMENEYRQTLWVTGAIRFVVDKIPQTREGMAAVFEVAMEMGQVLNAEYWKLECLKKLKAKPSSWWGKKIGDATPNDVVSALAVAWRARMAKEKGRPMPVSKWEVLVDMTGSREMCVLADVEKSDLVRDGRDWYYTVEGKGQSFQMMMRPTYWQGQLEHGTGEIIG